MGGASSRRAGAGEARAEEVTGAERGGERGADWLRGVAGGVFPGLGGGLRFGHCNFVCERERWVSGRQVPVRSGREGVGKRVPGGVWPAARRWGTGVLGRAVGKEGEGGFWATAALRGRAAVRRGGHFSPDRSGVFSRSAPRAEPGRAVVTAVGPAASLPTLSGCWAGGRSVGGCQSRGWPREERGRQGAAAAPRKRVRSVGRGGGDPLPAGAPRGGGAFFLLFGWAGVSGRLTRSSFPRRFVHWSRRAEANRPELLLAARFQMSLARRPPRALPAASVRPPRRGAARRCAPAGAGRAVTAGPASAALLRLPSPGLRREREECFPPKICPDFCWLLSRTRRVDAVRGEVVVVVVVDAVRGEVVVAVVIFCFYFFFFKAPLLIPITSSVCIFGCFFLRAGSEKRQKSELNR